ncbi:MAG TPA: hypothetical protein VFW33_16910 [Gemmataceae bacterium]|nr:hypothetical protein [Gemmataceae bacterium]
MIPDPATVPDPCYDCGCDATGGEQCLACLWKSPGAAGAEHWALVDVCPACARRRARRRRTLFACLFLLPVGVITFLVAYKLLP